MKSDLILAAEKMLHTHTTHKELPEKLVKAINRVDKLYGNWGFKAYEGLTNRQIVEIVLIHCELVDTDFVAVPK